jgi:hypothetical protein
MPIPMITKGLTFQAINWRSVEGTALAAMPLLIAVRYSLQEAQGRGHR